MPPQTAPTRCLIYVRISLDQARKGENIAMHLGECREYAADKGWSVAEVFADNNISASKYATKPRPEYERLLAWLEHDTDPAPLVVLTTEMSRLYRRMEELLELIKLAERTMLRLIQTTEGATYDLATGEGVYQAIGAVSGSMKESRLISDRQKRKHRTKAANGGYVGPRPFGYQRTMVTGSDGIKLRTLEPDPAEAPLVAEAAERVLAGEPLRSICYDWRTRDIRTPRGGYFTNNPMRMMLCAPRNVGIREHRPGGPHDKNRLAMGSGTQKENCWPPVLERDIWRQVVAVLSDPARDSAAGRGRSRSYLLTGLLFCGRCGFRMSGAAYRDSRTIRAGRPGRPGPDSQDYRQEAGSIRRYRCASGQSGLWHRGGASGTPGRGGDACWLARSADPVDRLVCKLVFDWLDSGLYDAAVEAERAKDDGSRELLARRYTLEQQFSRIDREYRTGDLSARAHGSLESQIQAEIDQLDKLLKRQRSVRAAALVPSERGDALRVLWKTWSAEGQAGLMRQRQTITALVGRVTIGPAMHGAFHPDQVQVTPGPWINGLGEQDQAKVQSLSGAAA